MIDTYIDDTLKYCNQITSDTLIKPTVRELALIERMKTIIQVYNKQTEGLKELVNLWGAMLPEDDNESPLDGIASV